MLTKNPSIVVAVDGSESTLKVIDYAIEIARKEDNARVILLYIPDLHTAKEVASSFIISPTYGQKEYEEYKKKAKNRLNKFKKRFEEKNIETRIEVVGGALPVTASIVNYAENENVDLILVGSRGKTGFKKLL